MFDVDFLANSGPAENIFGKMHFKLRQVIAEGDVRILHEARQKGEAEFVKRATVKLIREEYSKTGEFRSKFFSQTRIVAGLLHGNILPTIFSEKSAVSIL